MFEKAVSLLRENDNFLIVYDTDGDGLGAAAILSKTLGMIGKRSRAITKSHKISFIPKAQIEKSIDRIGAVVFLDISADEEHQYVQSIAKKVKVLIVDHHKFTKNLNGKRNIVHVNPSFLKIKIPSHRYCTSKLAFDICSKISDTSGMDWLAGIGILNDKASPSWSDFLNGIYKKYKINPDKLEEVNRILTSTFQLPKTKSENANLKACLKASSPIDILKAKSSEAKKLREMYEAQEKEIRKTFDNWKKNAKINKEKKYILLEIKSRLSIGSIIATKISFEKKNFTVIVFKLDKKFARVNLRRQDKRVDCSKLAKRLIEGLGNANGGGHAPAAGIKMLRKDWPTVRSRIEEL